MLAGLFVEKSGVKRFDLRMNIVEYEENIQLYNCQ